MKNTYTGYWTGAFQGTSTGGFTLDLVQNAEEVTGTAKFSEPAIGTYEYKVHGNIDKSLFLSLQPMKKSGSFSLGKVTAVAELQDENTLKGKWRSDIGTEGIFDAKKFETEKLQLELPTNNSVFIVHGHDDGLKQNVARFLEKLGIKPVILQEQLNKGMTIIEKFECFASRAGYAVILITPDDIGYQVNKEEEKQYRPRQNVILELGYFSAKLGRDKTIVLIKGDIEMPSDIIGLAYEQVDRGEGWKLRISRELKEAGFQIDLNNAI